MPEPLPDSDPAASGSPDPTLPAADESIVSPRLLMACVGRPLALLSLLVVCMCATHSGDKESSQPSEPVPVVKKDIPASIAISTEHSAVIESLREASEGKSSAELFTIIDRPKFSSHTRLAALYAVHLACQKDGHEDPGSQAFFESCWDSHSPKTTESERVKTENELGYWVNDSPDERVGIVTQLRDLLKSEYEARWEAQRDKIERKRLQRNNVLLLARLSTKKTLSATVQEALMPLEALNAADRWVLDKKEEEVGQNQPSMLSPDLVACLEAVHVVNLWPRGYHIDTGYRAEILESAKTLRANSVYQSLDTPGKRVVQKCAAVDCYSGDGPLVLDLFQNVAKDPEVGAAVGTLFNGVSSESQLNRFLQLLNVLNQRNELELLSRPGLLGKTLAEGLSELATQPVHPKLKTAREKQIELVCQDLINAGGIEQKLQGSCVSLPIQYCLFEHYPADAVALAGAAYSAKGELTLSDGTTLVRRVEFLDDDQTNRNVLERLLQAMLMDGADGADYTYQNNGNISIHRTNGETYKWANPKTGQLEDSHRAYMSGQARVASAIFGERFAQYHIDNYTFGQLISLLRGAKHPFRTLELDWNEIGDRKTHAVYFVGFDGEDGIIFKNSHGIEGDADQMLQKPARKVVDPQKGTFRMSMTELEQQLRSVVVEVPKDYVYPVKHLWRTMFWPTVGVSSVVGLFVWLLRRHLRYRRQQRALLVVAAEVGPEQSSDS